MSSQDTISSTEDERYAEAARIATICNRCRMVNDIFRAEEHALMQERLKVTRFLNRGHMVLEEKIRTATPEILCFIDQAYTNDIHGDHFSELLDYFLN